ncbi:MAG TPA: rhomboid family intramembrane serine protease [Puia sp.]|nr:rhomboid family intramembrane serine protease [Puia sp.]
MSASLIILIIIAATVYVSYRGFRSSQFLAKYEFRVDRILVGKDVKRLFTSGFLHVGWTHLLFNMFSLYIFSGIVQVALGTMEFLIVYVASLLGGGLLSLLIHRNHPRYSFVGASGAVCGVMFASVALFPDMGIQLFPLPFSLPSWLYAILFVGFSIYGVRSRKDNIGHDAHLGGALTGMIIVLILNPAAFLANFAIILMILVPTTVFIYLIITRPELLLVDNLFYKRHRDFYSIDHEYNAERSNRQHEIDRILDKINRSGMRSLSSREKQLLEEYSKNG